MGGSPEAAGPRITSPFFGLNSEPWQGQAMILRGRLVGDGAAGMGADGIEGHELAGCLLDDEGGVTGRGSVNAADSPDRHARTRSR